MSTGRIFRKVRGKWAWYNKETGLPEGAKSAAIHQDSFKEPLRHPVTGKLMDSLTQWNRTNERLGLECVGNDLLSKRKRTVTDKISDEMVLDRIAKAESILSDPTKYRDNENMQRERLERHEKMFGGNYRY